MLELIAQIYVNFLEPAGQVVLWLLGILILLSIFNFMRDPKAKQNMVNSLLALLFKGFKAALVGSGLVLQKCLSVLLVAIKVIFAAIRDFFGSKI